MPTGVILDDLNLSLVQEVRTREERSWVAHQVPGLDGAAYQNLGHIPGRIVITGVMVDDASLSSLENLREKFQGHEPLAFTADINTATDIKKVIIDDLRVTEIAGRPQQFAYVLYLREYLPPPPPAAPLQAPGLEDENLLGGVTDLLGSLPDLGGLNLDLVNPLPPMSTLVDGVTSIADQMTSALGPLNELLGG